MESYTPFGSGSKKIYHDKLGFGVILQRVEFLTGTQLLVQFDGDPYPMWVREEDVK